MSVRNKWSFLVSLKKKNQHSWCKYSYSGYLLFVPRNVINMYYFRPLMKYTTAKKNQRFRLLTRWWKCSEQLVVFQLRRPVQGNQIQTRCFNPHHCSLTVFLSQQATSPAIFLKKTEVCRRSLITWVPSKYSEGSICPCVLPFQDQRFHHILTLHPHMTQTIFPMHCCSLFKVPFEWH